MGHQTPDHQRDRRGPPRRLSRQGHPPMCANRPWRGIKPVCTPCSTWTFWTATTCGWNPRTTPGTVSKDLHGVIQKTISRARTRTSARVVKQIVEVGPDGTPRLREAPPVLQHVPGETEDMLIESIRGVSGRGPDRHRGAAVALSRHRCRAAGGRRRQRRHPVLLGHPGRPQRHAARPADQGGHSIRPRGVRRLAPAGHSDRRRRGEGPGRARRRRPADPAGDVGCVPGDDTQGRPRLLRPPVPRHEGHRRNRGHVGVPRSASTSPPVRFCWRGRIRRARMRRYCADTSAPAIPCAMRSPSGHTPTPTRRSTTFTNFVRRPRPATSRSPRTPPDEKPRGHPLRIRPSVDRRRVRVGSAAGRRGAAAAGRHRAVPLRRTHPAGQAGPARRKPCARSGCRPCRRRSAGTKGPAWCSRWAKG